MKKIIALLITALMLCSSISTAFALEPPYVESILIGGEKEITLHIGESVVLEATATPVWTQSAYITWSVNGNSAVKMSVRNSSDPLDPPVSKAKITALAAGEVTVTAYASATGNPIEYSDASDSVKITIVGNECEELYNICYTTTYTTSRSHEVGKITSVDELTEVFSNNPEILSRYDEEFFNKKFLYRIGFCAGNTAPEIKIDSIEDKGNEITLYMSVANYNGAGDMVITMKNALVEFDKEWIDKYFDIKGSPFTTSNMVKIPYYSIISYYGDYWDKWGGEPFPESRRTVIRSNAELTDFIKKSSYLPIYDEQYNQLIATYDDEFFESKSLVFVNHNYGDGSNVYYGDLIVKNIDNKFIIDAYQVCLPNEDAVITAECDWLVIFEVPSFMFATQDVSLNIDGVEVLSCSPYDFKPPATLEEQYNISYYTDISYFNDDIEGKITSYEELEKQFSNREAVLSKYNEAFFKNKFLYRIVINDGSPYWDMKVSGVTNVQDSILIELVRVNKDHGDAPPPAIDVSYDILLEFDKAYSDKDISSIEKYACDVDAVYDEAFEQNNMVFIKIDYYHQDNKLITVGDSELYYNSQKRAYFGLVDAKDIDGGKQSVVIGKIMGEPTSFTFGNLDEDEEIDASDLQVMKLAIKGSKALEGKYLIASDVDGDGLCDTADLQAMKLKIKNNKEFPILK